MTSGFPIAFNGRVAWLTCESPASSYQIPVLVIDGCAFGAADVLPGIDHVVLAGSLVAEWGALPERNELQRAYARRFCATFSRGLHPDILRRRLHEDAQTEAISESRSVNHHHKTNRKT